MTFLYITTWTVERGNLESVIFFVRNHNYKSMIIGHCSYTLSDKRTTKEMRDYISFKQYYHSSSKTVLVKRNRSIRSTGVLRTIYIYPFGVCHFSNEELEDQWSCKLSLEVYYILESMSMCTALNQPWAENLHILFYPFVHSERNVSP